MTIPEGTILGVAPSLSHSLVSVSQSPVAVGDSLKVTLSLRDSSSQLMVAKRYQVKLTTPGSTSVGTLSDLLNRKSSPVLG